MFVRDNFEWGLESVFSNGYGSTIWSPLCMGILTGKYNNDLLPEGRFKDVEHPYLKPFYDSIFGNN